MTYQMEFHLECVFLLMMPLFTVPLRILQTLQEELDKLSIREKTWLMEFNDSKCKVLTVTNKRSPIVTNYILHGQALRDVKSAKYFGITIIKDLKWNTHTYTTSKPIKFLVL